MTRDEVASAVKKKYAACMASPSVWDALIDAEWRNQGLCAAMQDLISDSRLIRTCTQFDNCDVCKAEILLEQANER